MSQLPVVRVCDEMETAFVRYVSRGVPQGKAAVLAGYADPRRAAWRLMQRQHVIAALQRATSDRMKNIARPLAVREVIRLIKDQAAPAQLRAVAIKLAWGSAAEAVSPDDAPKNLEDMSLYELQAASAAISLKMAAKDTATIDNKPNEAEAPTLSLEDAGL